MSIAGMLMISFVSLVWGIKIRGVEDHALYCKLNILEIFFMLEFFPVMFLYLKSLRDKQPFGWKDFLILLPGILMGGAVWLLYIAMGEKEAADYMREVSTNGNLKVYTTQLHHVYHIFYNQIYKTLLLLQVVFALVCILVYSIRHRQHLRKVLTFSKEERLYINEALFIALIFSLLISIVIAEYSTRFADGISTAVLLWLPALAVVLYYMGYHISRIELAEADRVAILAVADKIVPAEKKKNRPVTKRKPRQITNNPEEEEDSLHKGYLKILPEFTRLMEQDRIFLEKNLRLDDVANRLNTNRTYVSFLIRQEYDYGFSEYINRKRIAYVQDLVRQEPGLSQEQVAEKCGIVHSSSFSRVFKQYTGLTFREWQKTLNN